MVTAILKELARAAGDRAVDVLGRAIGKLLRRGAGSGQDDAPPMPLSHRDVERQQAQIRSATRQRTPTKPGGGR